MRYLLFIAVGAVLVTLAIAWYSQPPPPAIAYSEFINIVNAEPQSIREVTIRTGRADVQRTDGTTVSVNLPQDGRFVEDLTNQLIAKHIKVSFSISTAANPPWLLYVANIVPVALILIVLMVVLRRAQRDQGRTG